MSKEDRYGFKLAVGSWCRPQRLHLPITRFIKGSRMTWFYALWVYHREMAWTIWLGCPKDKIVRLVRLFRRHHDIGLPDEP